MPSKHRNGKGRSFGDWLEDLLDRHPEPVVFILVLLFAFAVLEPFLTQSLPYFWQTMIQNVRAALMNVVSAASILLGFYAIHQATSFRSEDAIQKRIDDLRIERMYKKILDQLTAQNKKENGLDNPRSPIGDGNEDPKPPIGGDGLSGKDSTV